MKLRPLHDRVAVRRAVAEKTSKGGIIIPDMAQDKQLAEGTVIAVGEGRLLKDGTVKPLSLAVGDRVLVGKYGGQTVTVEEQEIVMLHEDEVLAVFDK